jgi:hypothetical protein
VSPARYSLRLVSAYVVGIVPLSASTLIAAKALGGAWKAALKGSAQPFTIHVCDDQGVSLWEV